VGEGGRPLALIAATVADRVGEIGLAVATVLAVAAVAVALTAIAGRDTGRARVTSALVIVTGGAAVTFVAYLAFQIRCGDAGCVIRPGDDVAGIAPWWRIDGAWQWGAQLMLASVALVTSALALAAAARESRFARPLLTAARVAYVVWALLVFAIPALWEVFAIR
jgi:hypothetical protein